MSPTSGLEGEMKRGQSSGVSKPDALCDSGFSAWHTELSTGWFAASSECNMGYYPEAPPILQVDHLSNQLEGGTSSLLMSMPLWRNTFLLKASCVAFLPLCHPVAGNATTPSASYFYLHHTYCLVHAWLDKLTTRSSLVDSRLSRDELRGWCI